MCRCRLHRQQIHREVQLQCDNLCQRRGGHHRQWALLPAVNWVRCHHRRPLSRQSLRWSRWHPLKAVVRNTSECRWMGGARLVSPNDGAVYQIPPHCLGTQWSRRYRVWFLPPLNTRSRSEWSRSNHYSVLGEHPNRVNHNPVQCMLSRRKTATVSGQAPSAAGFHQQSVFLHSQRHRCY